MAKINHNNFIDTVDGVLSTAKKEGILHLYAQDTKLSGRTIRINSTDMLHFGTTGYLGLEQDNRLKDAAVRAIYDYGTQFPLSKSYISHPLYAELEDKVERMYGVPPIITKNSTLGHLSVIPTLVRDEDAVILDHQVHWSVQNACQLLKLRGIPVELIRHSNLEMLETNIKKLMGKVKRIWYMADGVYSMYGDYAPVQELLALTRKYSQLHLYFDDVHGMSWKGRNGTGFIFEALQELPPHVVVVSTLSKTFGASGATVLVTDTALREKIKNFGGPLTFSAQLEPASVAAAIASADIHLTPEIIQLQTGLASKIALFNDRLSYSQLPLLSQNDSPVFFLPMGTPATAYNFSKRLFTEGFFLNLGIYPAVPIRNTGIRITLSRHNLEEDIEALSKALCHHYHKALEETGTDENRVRKSFGLSATPALSTKKVAGDLTLTVANTVEDVPESEWNQDMAGENILDWNGLRFLEKSFKNSEDRTLQTNFFYFTIKQGSHTILRTFFTFTTWKDDMLSPASVSAHVEKIREKNKDYLTSKVLSMGSVFTEGNHCYIDRNHEKAEAALELLLHKVQELYEELRADMIVLRDFCPDEPYAELIKAQGYFPVDMPESCLIKLDEDTSSDSFSHMLSTRSRRHFKQEVQPYEHLFEVVVKKVLSPAELELVYGLYRNVHARNLSLNTFPNPIGVFQEMNHCENWEFLLLYLKESKQPLIAGVMFCYKNVAGNYVPELIGMDYSIAKDTGLYRQLLYQTILRAIHLKCNRIDLGISAAFEKKKLGATCLSKVAYIQTRDNFKLEFLQIIQNEHR